ncbi:IS481 family transposase [Paucibacter sp. KBW04]|uniref:IS481 family transposase n=1 Tax=Paucibacter sp. KBW04 TaxID=2153361 RepID=UPI000F5660A0|nr:IS481 family transposase [Paucibacter sp. KBW04]RQO53178.1 IS481 family transposase [Paucibacter sp. KBW04]
MVWMEKSTVSLRQEFVQLARQDGANKRELCRRFGISPKTGYKWLARIADGELTQQALSDASRRPHTSPARSPATVEQAVLNLRREHPAWGGRKIARRLADLGMPQIAPSTVTHILHRHGLISPQASRAAQHWQRFEHDTPNSLWQIDFKGHFATLAGRCHGLTLPDDHSRFSLLLSALARTDTHSVHDQLVQVFRRYGLPICINADNGTPWGCPSAGGRSLSELAIWLIRLGIRVSFSAPYHPQTNGKLERFHRTLDVEVIAGQHFKDHASVQAKFDAWRQIYNCDRPHEALGMTVPAKHYRVSTLNYPDRLKEIEYPSTDTVIKVGWNGFIHFAGHKLRTSTALHRLPIGIRPHPQEDGVHDVYFCHQRFMQIDLNKLSADT